MLLRRKTALVHYLRVRNIQNAYFCGFWRELLLSPSYFMQQARLPKPSGFRHAQIGEGVDDGGPQRWLSSMQLFRPHRWSSRPPQLNPTTAKATAPPAGPHCAGVTSIGIFM